MLNKVYMKSFFRVFSILIGFLLIAGSLGIQGVSAQTEYTDGVIAFRYCDGIDIVNGCFDTSMPYDPKVACSTDNSECVMLVYENRSDIQGIQVKYSTGVAGKHFENLAYGCASTGFGAWWDYVFGGCTHVGSLSVNYSSSLHGVYDNYHLPYDVTYYNGDFYMFYYDDDSVGRSYTRKIELTGISDYKMDGTSAYIRYDLTSSKLYRAIGFCDDQYIILWTNPIGYPSTNVKGTILDCEHWDMFMNTSAYSASVDKLNMFDNTDHSTLYTMSPVGGSVNHTSLGSFPTDYTGIDYYLGSKLVYQREHNASWVTTTNDFSVFSNTTVYYPWTAESFINHTDVAISDTNLLYSYEFNTNVTTIDGVYAYNDPVYSFSVRARGLDLNSLTIIPINVSSAITCNDGAWFYEADGVDQTLVSPCATNNTIFITASGWQPSIITLYEIDSLTSSGVTVITAPANGLGWVNSYDVNFGAFDKFASSPISGASIEVDSVVNSSDASGIATYNLYPYDDASFYISNASNTYYLELFGDPKNYDVQVSKTGYLTSDLVQINLTSGSPSDDSSFLRTHNTQLEPTNARIVVDLWWSDGIHYSGDTAVVRVGDNDGDIYLEDGSIITLQNFATSFPATFILQDSRSSWTANVNVTSGSHFDSDSISVVDTTLYYFNDFYLPNSSTTHECASSLGCADNFCVANVWYSDGDCLSGVCSYVAESCVLCDDDAGCYTSTTTETCPSGLDAECYDSNYCIDTKYLASFKCSSSKMCYMDTVECGHLCDEENDVCIGEGIIVECDQSTVTGLLLCVQSGIMSFIGSTYDPMFAMGLILFLAMMIVAIFVAGFLVVKGAMSARHG